MNAPHPPPRPRPDDATIAALTAELHKRYGNRVVTSLAVREQHGHTTTWVENQPPDIVVYPQSTEEVSEIVRLCAGYAVPLVAFGTGTSLEGHVNAPYGGVSIDTSEMKRIVAVHAEDLDCIVEPGVTRKELNEHSARPGPVLPDRSRRRRVDRRHDRDPRLRHQRRPLRHHEGQRPRPDGGAAERRRDPHGPPGEEELGRL